MARLSLIASSDDYLLEEALQRAVKAACAEVGGVEPEFLPPETTPEQLAVELCSLSLFTPQRVLVVPEVGRWIPRSTARRKKPGSPAGEDRKTDRAPLDTENDDETIDLDPLTDVIENGLADNVALVMGALCSGQPKGTLAKAVAAHGLMQWVPVPDSPKPWEDVIVSEAQAEVLRGVLARASAEVRFERSAERLLFNRLGFAPRLLAQEARKLAAACADGVVDEDLVRALSFPRERSLEVVRDAVFERRMAPLLDLMAAAEAGVAVHDWRGRTFDEKGVPPVLFGQVSALFQQLFYLRRVAAVEGLSEEMAPANCDRGGWYAGRFKNGIAPRLNEYLKEDAPSPLLREDGRLPSPWNLGRLFAGAGRYTDDELSAALADLGAVEVALRGDLAMEALTVWFGLIDR